MNTTQLFLLAQIVLIPITLCLLRFGVIKRLCLPLFLYLLVKEITEIISYLLIHVYHTSNEVPYNMMYLLEAVLISWQFYKLGAIGSHKQLYFILQSMWVLLWCIDMTLVGSFFSFNIMFRVTYCFILVFIAIRRISSITVKVRFNIYRNPAFILCIAFAWWFAYNIVYEFAEKIAHTSDYMARLSNRVTTWIGIAEALMYLCCTWALWCISKKQHSSTV